MHSTIFPFQFKVLNIKKNVKLETCTPLIIGSIPFRNTHPRSRSILSLEDLGEWNSQLTGLNLEENVERSTGNINVGSHALPNNINCGLNRNTQSIERPTGTPQTCSSCSNPHLSLVSSSPSSPTAPPFDFDTIEDILCDGTYCNVTNVA